MQGAQGGVQGDEGTASGTGAETLENRVGEVSGRATTDAAGGADALLLLLLLLGGSGRGI